MELDSPRASGLGVRKAEAKSKVLHRESTQLPWAIVATAE